MADYAYACYSTGEAITLEAMKVLTLPYPALLGHDVQIFWELIHAATRELETTLVGDDREESSGEEDEGTILPDQETDEDTTDGWELDDSFQQDQQDDPTLESTWCLLAVSDGIERNAQHTCWYPRIESPNGAGGSVDQPLVHIAREDKST
ncbi:UNVERIFIED_CONTAM: hypothetical protein K2H54_067079, partial [Gekko kuhli]